MPGTEDVIAERNTIVDEPLAEKLNAIKGLKSVRVKPYASRDVVYLTADEEEDAAIAQASSRANALGEFQNQRPSARQADSFQFEQPFRSPI